MRFSNADGLHLHLQIKEYHMDLKSFQISSDADKELWKVYYTFEGERELMYVAHSFDSAMEWICLENDLFND